MITDQIKRIQAARAAMFKDEAYKNVISQLENQLNQLQFGSDKFYRNSWNDLRGMKNV